LASKLIATKKHNYNFKGYYAIISMTFGKWNVVVVCSSYVTPTCEVTLKNETYTTTFRTQS